MKTRYLSAFSLIEVTVTLGLAGYCLISLVSLLSFGVDVERTARQRAAAASAVAKIAEAIGSAPLTSGQYQVTWSGSNSLAWNIGGATVSGSFTSISLSGDMLNGTVIGPQLVAFVQVYPPATIASSGTAYISVAWPDRATWNASSKSWSKAEGAISNCFIFLPKQ